MRADVLDEVPLLLQQVLLVGGDQEGGVALDHGDEAAEVVEVDVQGLGQVVVKVLHLVLELLEEGLVLLQIVNSGADTTNVLLPFSYGQPDRGDINFLVKFSEHLAFSILDELPESLLALSHQLLETPLRGFSRFLLQANLEALMHNVSGHPA